MWRNRRLVSAAAAVVLALAVGLGLTLRQAQRARAEAAKAGAISAFLQRTMATADPLNDFLEPLARDTGRFPVARDRKVVDVLDQAVEDLDAGEFEDQPLTEAALRFVIGRVYVGLGRPRAAERLLRRAYYMENELLGAEDPETLSTLVELVGAIQDPAEQEGLLESALQTVPRVLGREHRTTMTLMLVHAYWLTDNFRDDLAVEQLRELLAIQQRALPAGDIHTLRTMHFLALSLPSMGKGKEGHALAQDMLDVATRLYGEDHFATHMARKALARMVQGDYTEQDLADMDKTLDGLRRHLGEDHDVTLDMRAVKAGALIELQKFEDAEAVVQGLFADYQRLLVEGDYDWNTNHLQALLLWKSGRLEEAEEHARECLEALRPTGRDRPPAIVSAWASVVAPVRFMEVLYEVYRQQGRLPEALAMAREGLALVSAHPQEGLCGKTANHIREDVIYMLTMLGELQEAEALAREQVAILRRTRGPTHPATLAALNGLAWALFESGRFAEAEPLAAEAVQGYRQSADLDVLDRINTTDTLAVTLCHLGRPADAEPLFREIFELFAAGLPPRFFPGDAGLHALHYGECLFKLQRYPEAEARLLEALEAAKQSPAVEARRTVHDAHQQLVQLYDTLGMSERAAEHGLAGNGSEEP
jgi:tetratricopeptide (TPR) repeat protein